MLKNTIFIILILSSFFVIGHQTIAFSQSNENGDLIPTKTAEKDPAKSTTIANNSLGESKSEWGIAVVGFLLGGFLFLFLEIAIIPGFGIAGILGLILLATAIILAFLKLTINMAIGATAGAIAGLILLLLWLFYVFPKTSLGKKFVLEASSSTEDGFVAVRDLSQYVGKEGVAVSMLRPSGVAKIEDERIDVITDCEYIDKDTKIKVVKAKAGRIIVAPIEDQN